MNRQIIIRISATVVALAFFLGSVGAPKCAPLTERFREAQTQVSKIMPNRGKILDQDREKENHEKFQLVEWLIRQSLIKQYQKLEIDLDPDDNLD
jgi:hypothetical protein